jgi:hypothetical protein
MHSSVAPSNAKDNRPLVQYVARTDGDLGLQFFDNEPPIHASPRPQSAIDKRFDEVPEARP